jgi:hypothetical protein
MISAFPPKKRTHCQHNKGEAKVPLFWTPPWEAAKQSLVDGPCINVDETPLSFDGKTKYAYVLANLFFTLFSFQDTRGNNSVDKLGVFDLFLGFLVHDSLAT